MLENEFALIDYIEQAREEGIASRDDIELSRALYNARERVAESVGQVALFDVEIEG